jgi:hypothetical protein
MDLVVGCYWFQIYLDAPGKYSAILFNNYIIVILSCYQELLIQRGKSGKIK